MRLNAGATALCLLGIIDVSCAHGGELAGIWRVIEQPSRLTTCSSKYDTISVGETHASVREFLKNHAGPLDDEELRRREILKVARTENDEQTQEFISFEFYDGCNYHTLTYVQKVDGSFGSLPAYSRETQIACSHQLVRGVARHSENEHERDQILRTRQACDTSNALHFDDIKRIYLNEGNLITISSDGSRQKFERVERSN